MNSLSQSLFTVLLLIVVSSPLAKAKDADGQISGRVVEPDRTREKRRKNARQFTPGNWRAQVETI
jgi:hypothetical protein